VNERTDKRLENVYVPEVIMAVIRTARNYFLSREI